MNLFRTFFNSISSTLGRIVAYVIIGTIIALLMGSCEVKAISNGEITVPEWGNYVFGFDGGPHFGFSKIVQNKYVNIDSYYVSTSIPSNNKNFYINTFWGDYSNKPYSISFFIHNPWMNKNPYQNFTANGVPCEIVDTLDYAYYVSCKNVVPTKEGNNSRIEIRFLFTNTVGSTGTTTIGISKFNSIALDPATAIEDANNKVIDNDNKNHEEAQETRKGILGTLKSVFDSIVSLPGKIVDLLLDGLKSLFIPTEEQLTEVIQSSSDLAENFGFIGQSMNFMINLFVSLTSTVQSTGCITLPEATIEFSKSTLDMEDWTAWKEREICLGEHPWFGNGGYGYIDVIRTILTLGIVILTIRLGIREYDNVMSKNEGTVSWKGDTKE